MKKRDNQAVLSPKKSEQTAAASAKTATRGRQTTGRGRTRSRKKEEGSEPEGNDSILNWYLNEIHKIPMLTREQEQEVARKAQDGDREARSLLVRSNLRFVVTVARKYQSYGLSLMDLINEGNLGLIKASERFNPDRGFHFISYAVWWIKQSILFAIQQKSHLIRLPLNRTADLRRFEEVERWMGNQDNVEASLENMAAMLEMKPEELNHLLNMSRDHLSLDAPMLEGEDTSLGDNIEDPETVQPEDRVEDSDLRKDLEDSMSNLTKREKKVLSLRFGLGGYPVLSLQKIGKQIGLSKERIRQIEKKAIRKIRTGKYSQQLVSYLS